MNKGTGLDTTFLRSKVGQRMFILFVLCALVPVIALSLVSFRHVSNQLHEQSQDRLRQGAKAAGMSIFERILFLEALLETTFSESKREPGPVSASYGIDFELDENQQRHFRRVRLLAPDTIPPVGSLRKTQRDHLETGHAVLVESLNGPEDKALWMIRALDPQNPAHGLLTAEIEDRYLWGDEGTLPPMTDLCVFGAGGAMLYCSSALAPRAFEQILASIDGMASGGFEWRGDDEDYLAGFWSIPMFTFRAASWKVVMSEPSGHVLSPMADFKRTFPLVILLSLWVVLLLSINQIRRSLVPLEKLKEGTHRIASRDFDSRVSLRSGDEFQELAESFNGMASQLGRQFHALSSIADIDRVILSNLNTRTIVETVLARMGDVLPCRIVSVGLMDRKDEGRADVFFRRGDRTGETRDRKIQLDRREVDELRENPEYLTVSNGKAPSYLGAIAGDVGCWVVFPIVLKTELGGIVSLGDVQGAVNEDELSRARRLVDQVAVALTNAHLIEALEELNWGALIALARTIDAKSPWTLGHSERAAELAMRIGRVLGLEERQLDELHRGALLHDIGKIGIPPAILDKPGKLTAEEIAVMREHPVIGARILEPIAAYREAVPVVLQHHEWWDGSGYPHGAAAEEIDFKARIYAVADVFDALFADRPYRAGLARHEVIDYIRLRSGTQFDPRVVGAFLEVMSRDDPAVESPKLPPAVSSPFAAR